MSTDDEYVWRLRWLFHPILLLFDYASVEEEVFDTYESAMKRWHHLRDHGTTHTYLWREERRDDR